MAQRGQRCVERTTSAPGRIGRRTGHTMRLPVSRWSEFLRFGVKAGCSFGYVPLMDRSLERISWRVAGMIRRFLTRGKCLMYKFRARMGAAHLPTHRLVVVPVDMVLLRMAPASIDV